MAFEEGLAQRLLEYFTGEMEFEEKKMFGGYTIMVKGHMCVGVIKDNLVARVGPGFYDEALTMEHTTKMDFTKRPLKGYIYVTPDGYEEDEDLRFWIN